MKKSRTDYLILGNSTAAIGAVEGLRSAGDGAPAMIVAREPYHTYSRPLISYLLAGQVPEAAMFYRPRDFYRANSVETRLGAEAQSIDTAKRTVRTSDGEIIEYRKLLIATGGKPIVPAIAGLRKKSGSDQLVPGAFTFTGWDDAKAVGEYIEKHRPAHAVVLGGGLIGIKAAEALKARRLDVKIVELADRVLPTALDEQGARLAAEALREAGVEAICGTSIKRVTAAHGRVSRVALKNGRTLACDLLVVAIGVAPDLGLVAGTPIKTDRGILIDENCETSVKGIYAAGDVSQGQDALLSTSRPIPIFPNAYRQGFTAGVNMAGGAARVEGAFAMNSVEVFGLPTISIGLATAEEPEYRVLTRGEAAARTWRRIVLKDGKLVGALLVGDIQRAGILTGLIRERIDVGQIADLLLSGELGLLSLPAEYRKHVVSGEGIEV